MIPVPKQCNTREENATIKAGTRPAEWAEQPHKQRQKDTEARWTVKHGVNHYGYKNHINVDKAHKLIRRYDVTDAAVHDSQVLATLLTPENTARDVWADSAYRSTETEATLKAQQLRSQIQQKVYRNTPLTTRQRQGNRRRAQVRARVEHVFGHQVMAMGAT